MTSTKIGAWPIALMVVLLASNTSAFQVVGLVQDSAGAPMKGMRVTVYEAGIPTPPLAVGHTDDNGLFRIDVIGVPVPVINLTIRADWAFELFYGKDILISRTVNTAVCNYAGSVPFNSASSTYNGIDTTQDLTLATPISLSQSIAGVDLLVFYIRNALAFYDDSLNSTWPWNQDVTVLLTQQNSQNTFFCCPTAGTVPPDPRIYIDPCEYLGGPGCYPSNIYHEMAHYVHYWMDSGFGTALGCQSHNTTVETNPKCAIQEGWANYVAESTATWIDQVTGGLVPNDNFHTIDRDVMSTHWRGGALGSVGGQEANPTGYQTTYESGEVVEGAFSGSLFEIDNFFATDGVPETVPFGSNLLVMMNQRPRSTRAFVDGFVNEYQLDPFGVTKIPPMFVSFQKHGLVLTRAVFDRGGILPLTVPGFANVAPADATEQADGNVAIIDNAVHMRGLINVAVRDATSGELGISGPPKPLSRAAVAWQSAAAGDMGAPTFADRSPLATPAPSPLGGVSTVELDTTLMRGFPLPGDGDWDLAVISENEDGFVDNFLPTWLGDGNPLYSTDERYLKRLGGWFDLDSDPSTPAGSPDVQGKVIVDNTPPIVSEFVPSDGAAVASQSLLIVKSSTRLKLAANSELPSGTGTEDRLNQDWLVSVSGQTTRPTASGKFRVGNVTFFDTDSDGIADEPVRATGQRVTGSPVAYAITDLAFPLVNATFPLGGLSVSPTPPVVLLEGLALTISPSIINIGDSATAAIQGQYPGGVTLAIDSLAPEVFLDVSHNAVATISSDGTIVALSRGDAIVTARVNGVTSTAALTIIDTELATVVEGIVQTVTNQVVTNADVEVLPFGVLTETDNAGYFSVELPVTPGLTISANASTSIGGREHQGQSSESLPVVGGITDLGFITVQPVESQPIFGMPDLVTSTVPVLFEAGDIDLDGDQDVVAIGGSRTAILQNDGTGRLIETQSIDSSFFSVVSSASGDFDGDDDLDFFIGRNGGYELLLNSGAGTYGALPTAVKGGVSFRGAVAIDLDVDFDVDVVAAAQTLANGTEVRFLQNDGSGNFAHSVLAMIADRAELVAMRDFNGDSLPDILMQQSPFSEGHPLLFLNDGGLSFASPIELPGANIERTRAINLNADSLVDIVTIDNFGLLTPLINIGSGAFEALPTIALNGDIMSIADVDNDGFDDVLVVFAENSGAAFLNDGTGGFERVSYFGQGAGFGAEEFGVTDLNGDGFLDLVSRAASGVRLLLNSGDKQLPAFGPPLYPFDGPTVDIVAGQFDGDGTVDVGALLQNSYAVSWRGGNGDGTFGESMTQALGSSNLQSAALGAADIDGDGDVDLAAMTTNFASAFTFLNDGSGSFTSSDTISFIVQGTVTQRDLALGAIDNDGLSDIALSATTQFSLVDRIGIAFGEDAGQFGNAVAFDTFLSPQLIHIADVNNDQWGDIVTLNSNNQSRVSVLLSQGGQAFGSRMDSLANETGSSIGLGDLNGDDLLDVVLAPCLKVSLGVGDGTFSPPAQIDSECSYDGVIVADINGDNQGDIVACDANSGSITVFLGNGKGTYDQEGPFPAGGSPTDLLPVDLDFDGDLDIVVIGEVGNNGAAGIVLNRQIP